MAHQDIHANMAPHNLEPRQSMSMSMSMDSNMPMPTSSSSMDSSMYMTGRMAASQMDMTFFTSTTTPLYSTAWTPMSLGSYAGTCIFLILLSVALRALYAGKGVMEQRWRRREREIRRTLFKPSAVAKRSEKEEKERTEAYTDSASDSETNAPPQVPPAAATSAKRSTRSARPPFRLSVDLPRAALVTVMVGIGYLLMLAVMTLNVGYFASVLGGAFLGELIVGRWGAGVVEDHH